MGFIMLCLFLVVALLLRFLGTVVYLNFVFGFIQNQYSVRCPIPWDPVGDAERDIHHI